MNGRLSNALNGKTAKAGGMNLSELRTTLQALHPHDDLRNLSRKAIQEMYGENINLLVICGTTETVEKKISEIIVREAVDISPTAKFQTYWANVPMGHPDVDSPYYLHADMSEENSGKFEDDFFDYVVMEACQINANFGTLKEDTFKWVYRILKSNGVLFINDFSGVDQENADELYYAFSNKLCKLKTLDGLTGFLREVTTASFLDWEEESEGMETEERYEYIFAKYIDEETKLHYEEYLEGDDTIFYIGRTPIVSLEQLTEMFKGRFDISERMSVYVGTPENYILFTKLSPM